MFPIHDLIIFHFLYPSLLLNISSPPTQKGIQLIKNVVVKSLNDRPFKVVSCTKLTQYHCFFSAISSRFKIAGILWLLLAPQDFRARLDNVSGELNQLYNGSKDFSIIVSLLLKEEPIKWIQTIRNWIDSYPAFFYHDHKAKRVKIMMKNVRACFKAESLEILNERLAKFFRIESLKSPFLPFCVKEDVFQFHYKIANLQKQYGNEFTVYELALLTNIDRNLLNDPSFVGKFRFHNNFNQLIRLHPKQAEFVKVNIHRYTIDDIARSLHHCGKDENLNNIINWLNAGKKPSDCDSIAKIQRYLNPYRRKWEQMIIDEKAIRRYEDIGMKMNPDPFVYQ